MTIPSVGPFEKYSSWQRLVNIVGWILRFISNTKVRKTSRKLNNYLTVLELKDASEKMVI